jgi:hypothetical protein
VERLKRCLVGHDHVGLGRHRAGDGRVLRGTVTVAAGSSKTFTVSPRWFYKIYDVKVNGVSVGAVKSYTFSGVKSNQTISATFKRK